MNSPKKVLLLVVVVAAIALAGPWSPLTSDVDQRGEDGVLEADESGLSVDLALDRQVYEMGEPIALALVGINRADAPASLRFSSGKQYDFTITRRGEAEPVARWSAGRVFTMVIRNRELAPGEPIVLSAKWVPKAGGEPLPPGEYEMRGEIATTPPRRSEAVPFEIR